MRKISLKRVFALTLSLLFTLFTLGACKEKTTNNPQTSEQETTIADTNIVLAQDGVSPYAIVLSKDASVSEEYAGSTLQKYLELSTGALLPIVTDDNISSIKDGYALSVGRNELLKNSGLSVTENEVSRDGYKIVRKDNTVYICGGGDVGTTFGVYEFLKYQIGFEPYTKDEIYFEEKTKLMVKDFAYTDSPDFDYRMVDLYDKDTAFLLRVVNNDQTNAKYAYAGSKDWTPGAFHTIRRVLPEATYGATHSNWSYTSGGKASQLCLTNEELIATFVENLKTFILANPEARIVNISQDDYIYWCGCTKCSNEQTTYKTSGYVVRFVNKVINEIEEWKKTACPEREWTYMTFAYRSTCSPPVVSDGEGGYKEIDKSCIPHEKLYIRLTPITYCYSHSFTDENCEKNTTFYQEVLGWSSICKNFAVWDYMANYYHYLPFFNDFGVLKDNLQLYKQIGVKNLLKEYISGGNLTQFQYLRFYIASKLMWNAELDVEKLTDDFFANYYKDVAPQLREVYDLFRTHLQRLDEEKEHTLHFTVYSNEIVDSSVWPRNIVDRAENLLNEALRICDTIEDEVVAEKLRTRVLEERTCVQYLKLYHYQNYGYDMENYASLYNTFKNAVESLNVTCHKEHHGIAEFLTAYKP